MSLEVNKSSISDSLVLDDADGGVVVTGITDDKTAAKSGLQLGDEIVAATIHLDHLSKDEVMNILKVLEPYDNNMKVLTKKELNASASLDSLGLGLSDPGEINLNVPTEAPAVSLNSMGGDLKAGQGIGGGISGPTLNGGLPSISLNEPSADTGTMFTLPSLGLARPDAKADLVGSLQAPDVAAAAPPINSPSISVEKPEIKTGNAKYKAPKFAMPHFNLPKVKTPKAETDVSGDICSNIGTPSLALSGQDLNPHVDVKTPDLDVKAPNADLDVKGKWPHQNWKFPKIKGPAADLNGEASLSTPKIDSELGTVDVNLPKADVQGPAVNVKNPDLNVDAPSGKFWTWKMKKPKLRGPKSELGLDANVNTPDVDVSLPSVEAGLNTPGANVDIPTPGLNGPSVDLKGPDVGVDAPGKGWLHKMFKHGPKGDLNLDAGLNPPDGEVSLPKINGDLNTPGVDMKLPRANVDVPDANIDAPSSKIKFPQLKKPKFMLGGPKVQSPDIDVDCDVKAPDLSVAPPSVNGPSGDFNATGLDVDAPSGKTKWLTLKKPKWGFSGPKVNGPGVDINAGVPAADLNVSGPNTDGEINAPDISVKAPSANLDIDTPDVEAQTGIFKWFKKPKFGTLKSPKAAIDADVDAPNLKGPDVDVSVPKVESRIAAPGLNVDLPDAGIKGPDVEVDSPDLNLEGPDSKFKLPKLKLPKLKEPKVHTSDIDLTAPKVDVNAPNLKGPDVDVSVPKVESRIAAPGLNVDLPDAGIKGPDVEVDSPDLNLEGPDSKFKLPKLKLPKLKEPKVHTSDIDLTAPKVDVNAPNLKGPDVDVSVPKVESRIAAPGLNVDLPDAGIKGPDVEVDSPDLNLEGPDSKFKLPKLKLPKLKEPKVHTSDIDLTAPKVDVNAPNLKGPDVDVSVPKVEGGIAAHALANVKAPDAQLKASDLDVDYSLGDFKQPNFNVPKLGLSDPSVKAEVEAPKVNVATPDANIAIPAVDFNAEGDIRAPQVDVKAPHIDANVDKPKLLHFKLPKFNFGGKDVKAPEIDASANLDVSPDIKLKAPSDGGEINPLDVAVSGPTVDANLNKPNLGVAGEADVDIKGSPKSKLKNFFKWGGRKSVSGDYDGNGIEAEANASESELEVPAFIFHRLPQNSNIAEDASSTLGLPKFNTDPKDYVYSKGVCLPIVNATAKSGGTVNIMERLKLAKEKIPSANVSPTEMKDSIDLKIGSPGIDVSAATEDSSLVRGGTFKVEKPDGLQGLLAPATPSSDENDKLSVGLTNMLGLNIKDSDPE